MQGLKRCREEKNVERGGQVGRRCETRVRR